MKILYVFVKSVDPKCTTWWLEGVVTQQLYLNSIEFDCRPCHIADVRRVDVNEKNHGGFETTWACG